MDWCRFRNTGDRVFQDFYGGVKYLCTPGDQILIPWAAACLWFGDPNTIDTPLLARYDRKEEYERLMTRLGIYPSEDLTVQDKLEQNVPKFYIEDLDGIRVHMLIEDPEGKHGLPILSTGADDKEALAKELERVKQMQSQLLARLDAAMNEGQTLDDLPEDKPSKIPVDQ